MAISSSPITFVDITDTQKVNVHISSNYPITQIYDTNLGTFTPSWIATSDNSSLELSATVYADATDVSDPKLFSTKYQWFKDIAQGDPLFTTRSIVINENVLGQSETGMVTYICKVIYGGESYEDRITFSLVKTGVNGISAPSVQAQYSVNGTDGSWENILDSTIHKYIRFSYDGGFNWTTAIKITGEDGQSISLKGTAYTKNELVVGSTVILYSDKTTQTIIAGQESGDSYLVDGYLCVYNGSQFICTGQLQGPKGEDGVTYYLYIRYADNTSGSGFSTSPDNKKYIGFYRTTSATLPTNVDKTSATWNWAKFVGDNAKTITLTGSAQAFKIDKNNAVLPTTITVTAQAENTSVTSWTYRVDNETTFTSNTPKGISVSGNIVTITGTEMTSNSIAIKASDGTHSDVFTVYKIADGKPGDEGKPAPVAFLTNENISFAANSDGKIAKTTVYCNVVGYLGTTKVTPTIGVIAELPVGMSVAPNCGTAYTNSTLGKGNVVTLYSDGTLKTQINTTNLNNGDSYVVGTYLCKYNKTNNNFVCEDVIVTNNEIQLAITVDDNTTLGTVANISKDLVVSTLTPVNTNLRLTWSKINAGDKGDTGVGIKSTTVWYGVSDSASTQPSDDSWQSTIPVVVEGEYLWTRTVTDYTDDTIPETITYTYAKQGVKGDTGSSGSSVTVNKVEYQSGTSATVAPTGTWSSGVVSVAEGNYLWTKTTFSDGKFAYGVAKQGVKGDKGDKGDTGRGVSKITEYYLATTESSGVTTTTSGWTTTIQTIDTTKKYLWNYELVTYTDGTTSTTTPVIIGVFGNTGATGKGISSVAERYLATASSSGVTTSATGWTPEIQTLTATKKYLWNYEIITYTDGSTSTITPVIIGVYGDKGDQGDVGRGVSSIAEEYYQSTSATTQSGGSWSTTVPTWVDGRYIWTRSVITYTDSTTSTTLPVCITGQKGGTGIGVSSVDVWYYQSSSATSLNGGSWSTTTPNWVDGKYVWTKTITTYTNNTTDETNAVCITGQKGLDACTVMLTNESHIFAGDVSNATNSSTTTQVLAYKGSAAQSVTIVSVNGKTASTSSTATGIAGLSFSCSTLSGTQPTITFTCTTSFISPSGTIPIVVTVDGVTMTKMFTYSIAFKGTVGTPASLVSITPSALYFKSTTGKDGTFTPDYIYLYPRFQTVTYSKWEYSVDGGTTWVAASGANGISISTYNSVANTLRIAKTSTLYTDTVTSISFRCTSSNASIYDVVSIAKIYDVVDLEIGGRNFLLNTSTEYRELSTTQSAGVFVVVPYSDLLDKGLRIGDSITLSVYIKTNSGKKLRARLEHFNSEEDRKSVLASNYIENGEGFTTVTAILEDGYTSIRVMLDANLTSGTVASVTLEQYKLIKLEKGNKATDWSPAPEDLNSITFQIYAPKGYLLTNELPSLTLQTFAYEGSIEITSGATFQWSQLIDNTWTAISGATGTILTVTKTDVLRAKSYRCVMTYKTKEYTSTITVQDKTDAYNSIMCISSNTKGSDCYWVLYTLVYSDTGEVDPLLGPISITAPTSPAKGNYWYAVDATNATVQLKQYDGTSWTNSTEKQSLTYLWNIVDNGSLKTPIGGANKVQVISCHDFTATATLTCDVSNETDGVLTQSSLSITDASDPIVSTTEPTNAVDGQIWIKPNTNGAYNMFLWSESVKTWIPSDMDTRNKVYTTKPSSYSKGDIWITESDTAHSKYKEGTLLQASQDSTTYSESDWSTTLKYDKDIDTIQTTLKGLSEYVTITSEGLRIGAVSSGGELSPFTSLFTSTELAFYQNSEKLLTLANSQLTAPRVVIEEDLEVQGSISLGGLQFTIENNGSFSLVVTK